MEKVVYRLPMINMSSYISLIHTYFTYSIMFQPQKAGCYGIVPDVSDFQGQSQAQLPLKNFTYDVELSECLAYLQITQTYYNNRDKILDVQYVFPINPTAAVVSFQISFGGHTSRGVVKSKEQAQKQFKDNVQEGKEVGYGGYFNDSSKDIMRIKLGNISPKQEIKVKLCYVHPVSVAYNTFYQFRLSTTITPRYVSRLSQQQIQFVHPNEKQIHGRCEWFLRIKIKSRRQLVNFFSNTHQISPNANKLNESTYEVLITEPNMKPNKDFALYYTFANFDKPICMLSQSDFGTQAIISFVPKFCNLQLDDAKKRAIQKKEFPVNMSKTKGEYIFFLDRSGSMGGERIQKAKEALLIFLKSLPQNSYFNIVSFGSDSHLLFEKSKKYQASNLNQTLQNIKKMDADMGGTQILQAIKKCMQIAPIEGYTRQLFLLTDGSVNNTANVISYAALHTQFTRYNCIGIGNGCSQDLIINCAAKGKGHSLFIDDNEDPSDKIIEILEKSLSPVISKMSFEIDSSSVQSIVPNPKKMPFILKNELANFYINFNGKMNNNVAIKIKYSDTLGQDYSEKLVISPQNCLNCNYIGKMVSFNSINTLYNAYKYKQNAQEHMYYVKEINKEDLANKIIKQSIEKQILTELTAFICIDSSKADQITKSNIKQAKESVSIKPMNPADHFLKVHFGPMYYQFNSSQDIYVDECCMVEMYVPQDQSQQARANNPIHKLDVSKVKKPMAFKVINKSAQGGVSEFVSIKLKDPPKDIIQIIEKQQVNGTWNNDVLLRRMYTEEDLKVIKAKFDSYSKEIWATLAIIKGVQLYFNHSLKKVSLILRKAKEFIDNNANGQKYETLSNLWDTKVKQQSS